MSETTEDAVTEGEEYLYFEAPFISQNARISITVGTTFSHGGHGGIIHSHWPKVTVEDSPIIALNEDGEAIAETSDDCLYRVMETANQMSGLLIARMKNDIDERAALKQRAAEEQAEAIQSATTHKD